MLRRVHRFLGAILVLPLLLWTATGLAFHLKPGWRGAYEPLSAFLEEPLDLQGLQPVSAIATLDEPQHATRIELGSTTLGPVYCVRALGDASRLVDARTGAVLSPLDRSAGTRVAVEAASRAHASARYGAVQDAHEDGDAIAVTFTGGAVVRVDRTDLSISQAGRDTALIDSLYRIHYLQWTGIETVDRFLALAAIVTTWALAGLGLCLMRRRSSQ